MTDRVKGKIAIVTGAAMGIGQATAELLAAEGATVIVADIEDSKGRAVADGIVAAGGRAEYRHLDVTDEAGWQAITDHALAAYGSLDILVNNAGIAILKPIAELSLAEFRTVSRIDAFGTFLGVKHGIIAMRKSGRTGAIVNLSSIVGKIGIPGGVAYCGAKGAVRLLTKAAALEVGHARDMIRVTSVHPGVIRTPMSEGFYPDEAMWQPDSPLFGAAILKTGGTPRDVAEGILYLASDEGDFATGMELSIDGGWAAV